MYPCRFNQADAFGCKAGVEFGFLSTSVNKAVGLQYGRDGYLLEIDVNAVSRGCDISYLSYYKGEAEVLFAPLTCLEFVRRQRVEKGCVVVELNVVCTPFNEHIGGW